MGLRSKVVPGILVGGLVVAGGGSVLAAAGGSSSSGSSAKEQYCPPNSPQAGQPQGGPENNCGRGTPGGPPENRPPKPKFKVRHHPRHGCASRHYAASVYVANMQSGRKVRVYRDGHLIKSTSRHAFRVKLNVTRLKRGRHTLTVMTQDADGKWTKKKVRFSRC